MGPVNFNTRIEKKFFIHKDQKKDFLRLVKNYLNLHENPYDKEYTEIESIYYDSDSLYCYQGHFTQQDRFKLRVRNYSPDGKELDYSFLEFKHKNGPITDKQRVRYESRLTKKTIQKLNDHFVSDPRELDVFRLYLSNYGLSPISQIIYDRISLENEAIRITLDSNLKTKLLRPIPELVKTNLQNSPYFMYAELLNKYFESAPFLIVEIKDEHPDIAHFPKPLQEYLAHKRQNFSKYCYSITKEILK